MDAWHHPTSQIKICCYTESNAYVTPPLIFNTFFHFWMIFLDSSGGHQMAKRVANFWNWVFFKFKKAQNGALWRGVLTSEDRKIKKIHNIRIASKKFENPCFIELASSFSIEEWGLPQVKMKILHCKRYIPKSSLDRTLKSPMGNNDKWVFRGKSTNCWLRR